MFKTEKTTKISIEDNKSEKTIHTIYKLFNLTYLKTTRKTISIEEGKYTKHYFVFCLPVYTYSSLVK